MRKFWFLCTFLGLLIAIFGLFLMSVLSFFADSEDCQTANGPGTCSNDPTILIGAVPLVVGGAMFGIGLWRIFASPDTGPAMTIGRSGGAASAPPIPGGLAARQREQADALLAQYNVPGAASPPPPSPPPPE